MSPWSHAALPHLKEVSAVSPSSLIDVYFFNQYLRVSSDRDFYNLHNQSLYLDIINKIKNTPIPLLMKSAEVSHYYCPLSSQSFGLLVIQMTKKRKTFL